MNDIAISVPASVPQARKAVAAMERDIDAAKTYAAIRRLERRAEALKALFREYEEVRHDAERVILLARHRIGEELKAAPVAKASGSNQHKERSAPSNAPPTLAEQVGSAQRGVRLKKLAEVTRDARREAAIVGNENLGCGRGDVAPLVAPGAVTICAEWARLFAYFHRSKILATPGLQRSKLRSRPFAHCFHFDSRLAR